MGGAIAGAPLLGEAFYIGSAIAGCPFAGEPTIKL